jgi:hypothetical protein
LKKTTGCELDVLPDSCVVAYTEDEVFKLLYHTLFHCQFQRLIRVLDLHYNGVGWNIVNERVAELVPKDHIMRPYFMENERVPGKCLVRMKIDELYRDVSLFYLFIFFSMIILIWFFLVVYLPPSSQHDPIPSPIS